MQLTAIHPKLPMSNFAKTKAYYTEGLGFKQLGDLNFEAYAMFQLDAIELHFFAFPNLQKAENYGQVYIRTNDIQAVYQHFLSKGIAIHPNGALQAKPWGQIEFSLLDPDNNLLTFGQRLA